MRVSMPSLVIYTVYLCLVCIALAGQKPKVLAVEDVELPISVSGQHESFQTLANDAEDFSEETLDDFLELHNAGSAASTEDNDITPADWTYENKYLFGVFERVYASAYDNINKELVKQVPTDSAVENINYAKIWLNSLEGGLSLFKDDLKVALKQFIELEQIANDNKCNRVTYGILMKNLRGVRGKAIKFDTHYGPIRRVDKIVFRFAMEHAIKCLPKYPQLMNELIEREDLKPVERIAMLFGGLYGLPNYSEPTLEHGLSCKKFTIRPPKPNAEAEVLLKSLLKLASGNSSDIEFLFQPKHQNEEKGKMEVNRSKVEAVVDKYVIEPCKLFVREIGLNVVKPAMMDFSALDEDDSKGLEDEFNSGLFCVGRRRYSFCKIVINRRLMMIDNLMSEMRKHSYEENAIKLHLLQHKPHLGPGAYVYNRMKVN